ncbi:ATP-binding cassette sub-family A member 7-like [Physella acuta]|uniref:ATP-binding cassette sub-family A member 7-like n=1 Tax=Physella acuta TaxID=109671 RepID=UPI0027DC4FF5|nr:ATP-binding cassette sub-family A member 7-like [Physella acuta]
MQQWVMVIMHLASFGLQTLIISWLILERSSGAQQLQAVSGGHYVMFWCANFLFDLALSLVCSALLWGYVVALRASDFLYQHMLLMMLMQLVFSIVVLPFMYHYGFFISCCKPSTAVFVYITLILAHGLHVNRFTPLEETTVLISPNLHFFVNYISAAKLEGIPLFMLIVRYVTAALLFALVFWTLVLVGHLAFCHLVEST